MSEHEARALVTGRLRKKTTDESERTMATPGENGNPPLPGSGSENPEEDRVEEPEVEQEEDLVQDGRRNRGVTLLKQLARLRKI